MSGAIPPLPQYTFMVWCLVKHRDNFNFYIYYYTKNIIDLDEIYIVARINLLYDQLLLRKQVSFYDHCV